MGQVIYISLVLSLGSPSFAERETATLSLRVLQPEVYLIWASHHHDAEIAARGKMLLDEYYWRVAGELLPTNYPYQPWVDSLKYDSCDRTPEINSYLAIVNTCPGQGAPVWQKYRIATRHFIFHQLKAGSSKIEIVIVLDAMAAYEKRWINDHKGYYKFSAEVLEAAGK